MVKVLVSLDQHLIERLDVEAAQRGLSRDALLAQLVAKDLGMPLGLGAQPEVQRALGALDTLPWNRAAEDSTRAIRAERDAQGNRLLPRTMLAAESVLRKDWGRPEEDATWADL